MTMTNQQMKYDLPVHIEQPVLKNNPKFSQLVHILSSKLNQDGITHAQEQEKTQAENKLKSSLRVWLTSRLPYYELREKITELEIESCQGNLSLQLEQLTLALSDATVYAELPDYLPLPSESSSDVQQDQQGQSNNNNNMTVFGLSIEDLDRHNPNKQNLPLIQKAVLPMLEDRMVKKCQELHYFFTLHNQSASVNKEERKPLSLPMLVDKKKQLLVQERKSLGKVEKRRKESFLLYYQTLLQCLGCMERMLSHHKLNVQATSDRVTLEWMEAWVMALNTRIQLIIAQLNYNTFTPKTVTAIKIIRGQLEKAIRQTQSELNTTVQHLTAYRQVGSEFKSLVETYTSLKKELDDCKWGLEHFAATGSASGSLSH